MPNQPAIASVSLGRPGIHDLHNKLLQAAKHGFEGIEIFYDDLECLASSLHISILEAAVETRHICDSLQLSVVSLQPLLFYEGLIDRAEHKRQLKERVPLWLIIAQLLQTDLILIPSNFLGPDPVTGNPRTTGDLDVIVQDLRGISDLGLQFHPPIRFAYESIAWANHINKWEACWDIVCQVDRPNFGICLDTFNIAARVFADPASVTGKTVSAESDIHNSIQRLRSTIDPRKIFFVQVVDGERLRSPLIPGHELYVEGQPSRMSWSRSARLFPFEEDRGGYLPIVKIAKALFDTGFEGWVSLELFSRTLANPDPDTPEQHSKRGIRSWKKLVKTLNLATTARAKDKPPNLSTRKPDSRPSHAFSHKL
jgi:4-hydroxyphenylpyruvate dioxygenase